MNLLWCVPGVGGSEEYLIRQLVGLASIDHAYDVHVYAPRGFSLRHPDIAQAFVVHEAPSSCSRRLQRIVFEHTWLAWQTRKCAVVHHGGGTIARIGNSRTLLTIHDVQWTEYPEYVSPVKLRYLKSTVPSSLRRATRVAVPSQFVADTLTKFFSVNPNKVSVVRHGLQENIDTEVTAESVLREKFELGSGPVVVYPAITHPHKNHKFLLQLMADNIGPWADPELRLVFAGSEGSAHSAVLALLKLHDLKDRVVMPGRVTNADRNGLLAMADAMVFPSEYEGFGAPVIEAMKFGCPVVCSDQGSLPEIVGDAGLICALNQEAWGAALLDARQKKEDLVAKGHLHAMNFTASLSAVDLLREYDAIVSTENVRT